MKQRTARQIRSTNRNWALFDLAGIRSRLMRIQSQGVVKEQDATKALLLIEKLKSQATQFKP